jgi:hypothetical protein
MLEKGIKIYKIVDKQVFKSLLKKEIKWKIKEM